jgi:TatA/E family protein of Tat protein translocase
MFTLGVPELLIIFVIVLLLFGGKRIPEIGRAFGKSIREFKKASDSGKEEISSWINTKEDEESSPPETADKHSKKDYLQDEIEKVPGVKEAQEIKETAKKIKAASKFFFKK